jgi:hypothetical protein
VPLEMLLLAYKQTSFIMKPYGSCWGKCRAGIRIQKRTNYHQKAVLLLQSQIMVNCASLFCYSSILMTFFKKLKIHSINQRLVSDHWRQFHLQTLGAKPHVKQNQGLLPHELVYELLYRRIVTYATVLYCYTNWK